MNKLKPLVICGPSGAGKSTLIKLLLSEFEKHISFSISCTSRPPRSGEEHGREYFFLNRDTMEQEIKSGKFLEYAEFSGNLYGTRKDHVEEIMNSGKICLLDIDTQGVKQLKESGLEAVYVFIRPPSEEVLMQRLKDRGTETENSLQKRLQVAKEEIAYGLQAGNFDCIVVNNSVEEAYGQLRHFVRERLLV